MLCIKIQASLLVTLKLCFAAQLDANYDFYGLTADQWGDASFSSATFPPEDDYDYGNYDITTTAPLTTTATPAVTQATTKAVTSATPRQTSSAPLSPPPKAAAPALSTAPSEAPKTPAKAPRALARAPVAARAERLDPLAMLLGGALLPDGSVLPPPGECPQDVFFLLDASGSVKEEFEKSRAWILDMVKSLNLSTRRNQVALLMYAGKHRKRDKIQFGEFTSYDDFAAKLLKFRFVSGTTLTGAALRESLSMLPRRRPGVPLSFVSLTDGYSYDAVDEAAAALRALPKVTTYAAAPHRFVNQNDLLVLGGAAVFVGEDALSRAKAALDGALECT